MVDTARLQVFALDDCWILVPDAVKPPKPIFVNRDDTAAVATWAWLGNQDQPGAPTIWRELPVGPEK